MGENRQTRLLNYMVKENDKWIKAQLLADLLEVSTRQVRKYITTINSKCDDFLLIESGRDGYRLNGDNYFSYREKTDTSEANTPSMRQNYIIQKLVTSTDGYDIFDFSDELYVSLPTIENDLKNVRKSLEHFNLSLKRSKNVLSIEGEERTKRLLMRNMILPDTSEFDMSSEIQLLTFHYHFWDFRKNIRRILVQENDLFSNDYSINNIALHAIVMIDRIRSGAQLESGSFDIRPFENTVHFKAAKCLTKYFCDTYEIEIPENEFYQLFITISNNTTIIDHTTMNIENIHEYISQEFIDITEHLLKKVESIYYLDPFDDEFKVRFIIHVSNLFQRIRGNYLTHNPLTFKIKGTYPLIYDIAVFIAQEFENGYAVHLSEDEIAYIALHIGGYFENNLQKKSKVSCIFIYENYYESYKRALDKISTTFSSLLYIDHVVSLDQYYQQNPTADFIISMADKNFTVKHTIINPILTTDDIENIRVNLQEILKKKQNCALKEYLSEFVVPELFYKNAVFSSKVEAINTMVENAVSLGFAQPSLAENILQREALSDTAFDGIAVPHSLREDVDKSFISFAISDTPMNWGEKQVYIIALIGVNQQSRKSFTLLFDFLIDLLSEIQNVKDLAVSKDFDEFFRKLSEQLEK